MTSFIQNPAFILCIFTRCRLLLLIGILLTSVSSQAQQIYYVTPNGGASTQDGTSWATAFAGTALQGTIETASAYSQANGNQSVQVWVAAGTYKPLSSFSMRNNVAIYGGFSGNEAQLVNRPLVDLTTPSSTTLSGEAGDPNSLDDNLEHVFSHPSSLGLTSRAILDGFVITRGKGDGGGMYNTDASPTIRNCIFTGNGALYSFSGGGMQNNASNSGRICSPVLINCSFIDNTATFGAGMYNIAWGGGGLDGDFSECSPILTNCIFTGNSGAANIGAGMYNSAFGGNCSPILTNCTFSNNSAAIGSGISNESRYYSTCRPIFTNCNFIRNKGSLGSVMYSYQEATGTTNPVLTNCIVWQNNGSSTFYHNFSTITITTNYSLLETTVTGYTGENNRITDTSPFVSDTDLQLSECSPAIDAGDPASTTATSGIVDMFGNPRFYNSGRVDMGAFEFQGVLPSITGQPASASTVCSGSPVSVSVTTVGNSLAYQWFKDGISLGSAQKTATLNLPNAQLSDAGSYSVVVTGCLSLTSNAFTLIVSETLPAPVLSLKVGTTLPILQNTPFLSLTITGCEGGSVNWSGSNGMHGSSTTLSVPTSATGTLVYSATCTNNNCSSPPGSTTVTIEPAFVTGSFDGFVNGADCSSFRGWAWDRNKVNTAVSIDILDGTTVISTLTAGDFRQDLLDAGKGNGKHAFRFTIPDALKDGLAHNLSARIAGSSFILKDSPKAIICQGGTTPPANKPPVAPSPTVLIAPLAAQVGVPFSATLVAFTDPENGTLAYGLTGLPNGLNFGGGNSRVITGIPTENGSFQLIYSATDPQQATNSVSFVLTVNPASTTGVTGSFEGYLDKVECGTIRGWVWDRNQPNSPVTIEFYTGTTVWGSTLANIYRVDLKNAGKGNGVHAYSFEVPAGLKGTGTHVIYGRVQGSTYVLKDSGKPLTCPSPTRRSAEKTDKLDVVILGNPIIRDVVEVEVKGAEGQPLQLQVLDVNGRLVSENRIEKAGMPERQTLPVRNVSSGMLLLRVTSGLRTVTLKVVKP